MSQSLRQPRIVALLLGSIGVVSLLVWSVTLVVTPRVARADEQSGVTVAELQALLTQANLDTEALAATGISANTAGQVALLAAEAAIEDIAAIRDASDAFASADVAYHAALRLSQRQPGQTEGLATAQQALTTATTALNASIAEIHSAGTVNLTLEQKQTLATVAANRRYSTDAALAVVNRTEAQWVALRDALSNERIQTERGLSVDENAASLLSTARGASAVVTAQAALTTNLAAVREAWTTAIAGALAG